jgi:hypothetical protein
MLGQEAVLFAGCAAAHRGSEARKTPWVMQMDSLDERLHAHSEKNVRVQEHDAPSMFGLDAPRSWVLTMRMVCI